MMALKTLGRSEKVYNKVKLIEVNNVLVNTQYFKYIASQFLI